MAASGARCRHIEPTGYDEYRCRLSGASVEPYCRALDDGDCIPRKAQMVRAGSLSMAEIPKDERAEVRRMAAQMTEQAQHGVDVSQMTAEDLEALLRRAGERKREIRAAERQRQRLLPRLLARLTKLNSKRTMLTLEIDRLAAQIEEIKEGREVKVATARKGRSLSQAQLASKRANAAKARAAQGRVSLTPEERRERKAAYQRKYNARKAAEKREAA